MGQARPRNLPVRLDPIYGYKLYYTDRIVFQESQTRLFRDDRKPPFGRDAVPAHTLVRPEARLTEPPPYLVWARAGILVNGLARPAMFPDLPTDDTESHAQISGEPGYVSLRRLLRSPPSWSVTGRTVYVCENPNFLAIAADKLGRRCPR
jgi:hypothetical protein